MSPPKESEKSPTGLDYCRKAVEVFSKKPLPSLAEVEAQFKRNNEQIRLMEEEAARPRV